MTEFRIPFNRPTVTGGELDLIRETLELGHISGGGRFGRRCETLLEKELGVERALLTTSCTHALEMSALLLEIGPGDEVIVPAFAFVTTAGAFALRGARIVFADVRPDTLNLDENALPSLVTERTRAVVALHYAGVSLRARPDRRALAAVRLPIVEDNAHGLFARYRGRPLGTFGVTAGRSFHETKNFTCGEGGALLVNDPALVERAEVIREKGTNRSRFFRGLVDKYTWVDVGSSYVLSDLQAAFLSAQLAAREAVQERRRAVWDRYAAGLAGGRRRPEPGSRRSRPTVSRAITCSRSCFRRSNVRTRLIDHLSRRGSTGGLPLPPAQRLGDGPPPRRHARAVPGRRGGRRPATQTPLLHRA